MLTQALSGVFNSSPLNSFWGNWERMEGVVEYVHWLIFILIASSVLKTKLSWISLWKINTFAGLIVATLNGYVHQAMTLGIGSGGGKNTAIGIGMWLGLIMAYNVWFIIWPNQKKALGLVEVTPEIKAKSAKTAMLTSRINTLLSLPMLLSMVMAQNLY